jgi:hypothetical protein
MTSYVSLRRVLAALTAITLGLGVVTGAEEPKAAGEKTKGDKAKAISLEKEITKALDAFFATDFGTTLAQRQENRKKAFELLAKNFGARRIKMRFPIKEVRESNGGFILTLDDRGTRP